MSGITASAQQISIIPITDTAASNGAYVRGMSNDGKRIVFESSNDYTGENKDGNNEVFVYDVDARKVIQITQTSSQASGGPGGGGGNVPQGRNCPGGCPPSQASSINAVPAISGDGTRIVFASTSSLLTDLPNADGNAEIYLATLPRGASAATLQRITETDGAKDTFDNNTPTINFDGTVIAFVSTRRFFKSRGVLVFSAQNVDNNAQLYVYNTTARQYAQVTHKRIDEGIDLFDVKGFISSPFLSGDGKWLAFLSGYNFNGATKPNNADLNGEIFLYQVGDPLNQVAQVTDTSNTTEVPEDGAVNVLSRFGKHLSDDGSLLVFESAGGASPVQEGAKIRDVFLYSRLTKTFTQITAQDVGKRDLSDFNYFPSLNGAGTFVTFSSKLNLAVVNDTAGNFNNSREMYRYEVASKQLLLGTETGLSTETGDQRLVLFAPYVSDDGQRIAFSNNGNLIASKFNTTPEVFQVVLRPVARESGRVVRLANAASFDETTIARGSLVAGYGAELPGAAAQSQEFDNYPFELNGVSVTVGEALGGIAARIIAVAPGQLNFVFPSGVNPDTKNDIDFVVNNNGVLSRGKARVYDASPGVFTVRAGGRGQADARCFDRSADGKENEYTALPCRIGYDRIFNALILYGTGWRFGGGVTVRLRFINKDKENDELEITPAYTGGYVDEDGKEHLGMDEIRIALDKDLINITEVETTVLLDSNGEALESQEQVTTAFAGFEEDMRIINGATQSAGAIARGSIAWVLTDNDDEDGDEAEPEDTFTDKTIATPPSAPVLELDGVRVRVAGVPARILRIAPDEVRFVVPETIEAAENVLVQVTTAKEVFNTRVNITNVAPGVFTVDDDGKGKVDGRCGLVNQDGTITYSKPPCDVSAGEEKRILVLQGTGWRFATGIKAVFDNVELIPTYAGPEPGLPGVDRIEIPLDEEVAGREKDIILKVSYDGSTLDSQTGATIAFNEISVDDLKQPHDSKPPRVPVRKPVGATRQPPAPRLKR
ncbi:MAG: hypothetical protein ACREEM_09545 [Blastocatellia bacterium]